LYISTRKYTHFCADIQSSLIIHPRTQKDFYGNKPNLEAFKDDRNALLKMKEL